MKGQTGLAKWVDVEFYEEVCQILGCTTNAFPEVTGSTVFCAKIQHNYVWVQQQFSEFAKLPTEQKHALALAQACSGVVFREFSAFMLSSLVESLDVFYELALYRTVQDASVLETLHETLRIGERPDVILSLFSLAQLDFRKEDKARIFGLLKLYNEQIHASRVSMQENFELFAKLVGRLQCYEIKELPTFYEALCRAATTALKSNSIHCTAAAVNGYGYRDLLYFTVVAQDFLPVAVKIPVYKTRYEKVCASVLSYAFAKEEDWDDWDLLAIACVRSNYSGSGCLYSVKNLTNFQTLHRVFGNYGVRYVAFEDGEDFADRMAVLDKPTRAGIVAKMIDTIADSTLAECTERGLLDSDVLLAIWGRDQAKVVERLLQLGLLDYRNAPADLLDVCASRYAAWQNAESLEFMLFLYEQHSSTLAEFAGPSEFQIVDGENDEQCTQRYFLRACANFVFDPMRVPRFVASYEAVGLTEEQKFVLDNVCLAVQRVQEAGVQAEVLDWDTLAGVLNDEVWQESLQYKEYACVQKFVLYGESLPEGKDLETVQGVLHRMHSRTYDELLRDLSVFEWLFEHTGEGMATAHMCSVLKRTNSMEQCEDALVFYKDVCRTYLPDFTQYWESVREYAGAEWFRFYFYNRSISDWDVLTAENKSTLEATCGLYTEESPESQAVATLFSKGIGTPDLVWTIVRWDSKACKVLPKLQALTCMRDYCKAFREEWLAYPLHTQGLLLYAVKNKCKNFVAMLPELLPTIEAAKTSALIYDPDFVRNNFELDSVKSADDVIFHATRHPYKSDYYVYSSEELGMAVKSSVFNDLVVNGASMDLLSHLDPYRLACGSTYAILRNLERVSAEFFLEKCEDSYDLKEVLCHDFDWNEESIACKDVILKYDLQDNLKRGVIGYFSTGRGKGITEVAELSDLEDHVDTLYHWLENGVVDCFAYRMCDGMSRASFCSLLRAEYWGTFPELYKELGTIDVWRGTPLDDSLYAVWMDLLPKSIKSMLYGCGDPESSEFLALFGGNYVIIAECICMLCQDDAKRMVVLCPETATEEYIAAVKGAMPGMPVFRMDKGGSVRMFVKGSPFGPYFSECFHLTITHSSLKEVNAVEV